MRDRLNEIAPLELLPYAQDIITDYGNNTWFRLQDLTNEDPAKRIALTVYVPSKGDIYYRLKGADAWTTILNSSEHPDITGYFLTAGDYELTTAPLTSTVYCNVKIVDVGTVSYSDGVLSVSGYSENLTPVWYQLYYRFNTPAGYYYSDTDGHKMFIVEAGGYGLMEQGQDRCSAAVTAPPPPTAEMKASFFDEEVEAGSMPPYPSYLGWCARVFFQTGYGYCRADICVNQ